MIDKAKKREVQNDVTDGCPIMRVISMIDEMMTLFESDDEAKALTRQITVVQQRAR